MMSNSGIDHQDNPNIDEAVRWLSTTPRRQREKPAVPLLRERFGLTAQEACQAIAAANLKLARAG
ncbi:hypothetical protein LB557_30950 [Mesorhizobium sp. BR115XR7A]|uniref:hypothetical protein n=1 Tax=Mesorhizobium sp. BR115XR7A TaxID=2876645 RepID=UPI001CC9670A|nr:hypothetical protein [Mesorhizobium sp. BR115XR7A]MBZ9910412.1 hypothetical protein [Mesorhizobium sp. BR115XR7A]MBZ9933468.1 hypothetical protein [Mesorhizobium sp. BR1-1-5]